MSPPSTSRAPTRRCLLETALGATTVVFAGCLAQRDSKGVNTDDPSGGGTTIPEPNDSPTQKPSPSSDGRHDFWISNRTGTDHSVDLTVTRAGTDETVVAGCYESPDGLAIRFPDVGETDVTYDVTATLVGDDTVDGQWLPSACPEAYTGLYGTDGGIVIEDDSVSITQNECDYASIGDDLPTMAHADLQSCPEPTPTQSVTTISPSRTSTG